MATELGKAYVQIIPSAKGIGGAIQKELDPEATSAGQSAGGKIASALQGAGGKFGAALKTAMKAGTVAIGAVGGATALTTKAIIKNAGEVAEYGDNIDKMSQKMGLSAEKYQEWDAIMQHSGTSMEAMKSSMKTLANAAENGSEAFEMLGISQEDVANMSQEELFEATISALQNVENTTQRTYLAGKLLGKGATELGPLLNTSAEDTEAMRKRVHELGGVMSNEAVKAAAAYQDSLQDMQTAFTGLKRGLVAEMLPSITTVMDGLGDIFSGNGDKGVGLVRQGVSDLITNISNTIPRVTEIGKEILMAITTAISENLPQLVNGGVEIITSLLDVIIQNIPLLLEAGITIIQALGTSLIENAPMLWEKLKTAVSQAVPILLEALQGLFSGGFAGLSLDGLPDVIQSIGMFITDMVGAFLRELPQFIQFGTDALVSVVNGLLDALPGATTSLLNVVTGLVDILLNNLPQFLDSGAKMLGSLTSGLSEKAPDVIRTIGVVLSNMLGKLMDALPSMLEKGVELLGAVANGILKNLPAILSALKDVLFQLLRTFYAHLPQFLQKGIELIGKIMGGIVKASPQLLRALGDLVFSIRKEFMSYDWLGIGWNLLLGIAQGIYKAVPRLVSAAIDALANTWDAMNSWLGNASPSKKARDEIGKYWAQGIGIGFAEYMPVSSMVGAVSDAFSAVEDATVPALGAAVGAQTATGGAGPVYIINYITINQQPGEDADALLDRLIDKLTGYYEREGAVFANGVPT